MKHLSPLRVGTLMVALLVAIALDFYLLTNLLVSALNPIKTPFFDVAFVGLVGFIPCSIALTVRKMLHSGNRSVSWYVAMTVIFAVLGVGGYVLNASAL